MLPNTMNEHFLSLNEQSNSLDYLDRSVRFLGEVNEDPMAWKWATIALHGALYGFAVCASRGTSNLMVERRDGKLINFWKALELCQDENCMGRYVDSQPLVLTAEEKQDIEDLVSLFRNSFEHFMPKTWLIALTRFPKPAITALRTIQFIALDTGTILHRLRLDGQDRVRDLVDTGIGLVEQSSAYRELIRLETEDAED